MTVIGQQINNHNKHNHNYRLDMIIAIAEKNTRITKITLAISLFFVIILQGSDPNVKFFCI